MSYRTFKRLLGETSLERKCRFLLGGGLLLLISTSFAFYWWRNSGLVYEQNKTTARSLVWPALWEKHLKWAKEENDAVNWLPQDKIDVEQLASSLKPEDVREYSWDLFMADLSSANAAQRPDDEAGYDALAKLKQGEPEIISVLDDIGEYHYYSPVYASRSCISCHIERDPDLKSGDLMGMVKITMSIDDTKEALAWNRAMLIATAIITAFLAMLASYAIVRYVIVKPVLHLKDVSDEITRGNLGLRADIRTGDEFEELSHAFNRMLRHLVTVQDELRNVNTDLDSKVDELAHVNLKLYELNKVKDGFLATMSHELRTPLTSILGFSDVLAGSDNLTGKQERFVRHIQTSGRDLQVLINDILDLAKIESGKMDLQVVDFSLDDLVQRQVGSMQPQASRKNIELTCEIETDLPTMQQDSVKLQQILNNLLSNAVKFTPEGGRVQVLAHRFNEEIVEIVVQDTGIGIPLEEQETIFEKFRQGRSVPGQADTMTREYGGTGLGLSIVMELSKLLGGVVFLESEFGKGSTFVVQVPIVTEPTSNFGPSPSAINAGPANSETALPSATSPRKREVVESERSVSSLSNSPATSDAGSTEAVSGDESAA